MYRFLTFIFLIIISKFVFASFDINNNIKKIHREISYLNLSQAELVLEYEKEQNPDNLFIPYYENNIDFLKYIVSGDNVLLENFINDFNKRIDAFKIKNKNEPFLLALQAEMYFQLLIAYLIKNDFLHASFALYKSYSLWNENYKKYPDFKFNNKLAGIFQLLISSVPQEYTWLFKISGIKGNIPKAIDFLEKYSLYEKNVFEDNIYSTILLLIVYSNFENNLDKTKIYINNLGNLSNKSMLIKLVIAKHYMATEQNDKAIQLLEDKKYIDDISHFPYVYYILGKAKLNRLDDNAEYYLNKFLKDYKGFYCKKSTCLNLSWYYILKNDSVEANKYKKLIINYENSLSNLDKQAAIEIQNINNINIELLKVRLLFDGGYYQKALKILNNDVDKTKLTIKDRLEYIYRAARIFHKLKDFPNAKKYYIDVIKFGNKLMYYFAPNASLQLGLIYEQEKNYEKAEKYFKYCLKINKGEYKNSIEQKAKAGLKRLKEQ
ncbi:MAG: tetratricopeptide repeat protein [Bacteroidales bacterium]|nr:tetratricopeptide repeat protein [Bacteroidales bacterium]